MSVSSVLGRITKRYFVSGLLVVVPLIVTYLVLKFLFEAIDGILQPLIFKLTGLNIPGLGVMATLLLVIITGLVVHNYVGNHLLRFWELILARVPIVRPIYSGAKQLVQATTSSSAGSFKEVVLIEYPRKGSFALGFVAQYLDLEMNGVTGKFASVFVPSTPTPLTGMAVIVSVSELIPLDLTVEQGIKFIVSGGVVAPSSFRTRPATSGRPLDEVTGEAR